MIKKLLSTLFRLSIAIFLFISFITFYKMETEGQALGMILTTLTTVGYLGAELMIVTQQTKPTSQCKRDMMYLNTDPNITEPIS